VHSPDTGLGLLIGLLLALALLAGIRRADGMPHVQVYLGLLLVLMATLSPAVTVSWINVSRAVIAGFPLSAWAVTARA
jgi:hypothetical protein